MPENGDVLLAELSAAYLVENRAAFGLEDRDLAFLTGAGRGRGASRGAQRNRNLLIIRLWSKGMTQQEIARVFELDQSRVSRIVRGVRGGRDVPANEHWAVTGI